MGTPSGRFVLRLPPSLHRKAKLSAREAGVSLNELCVRSIEAYISGEVGNDSPVIADLKEIYSSSLRGVVLFGSVSRGEQREESDIDLLLVMSDKVELNRRLYTRWDQEEHSPRLSPHFVHQPATVHDAGSIWLEAAIDGVILFEADGSLARLLRAIRHSVLLGRFQRKTAYGHPYWVRKNEVEENVQ